MFDLLRILFHRLFIFCLFVLFCQPSFASSSALRRTLSKYAAAQNIELQIKKTDEKVALGTQSTSEGKLKFAKDKIYISLNGEKKIEFFYKKKSVWLVEYPDLDFDKEGKRKVTVLTKTTPILMTGLIQLFSNPNKFLKEFTVSKEDKAANNRLNIEFKPKQKNMKSLSLVIDSKELIIKEVSFTDDVDTKTKLELSQLKLNTKMRASDFDFVEQASDEVTKE